jgi:hypothetical protein
MWAVHEYAGTGMAIAYARVRLAANGPGGPRVPAAGGVMRHADRWITGERE